MGQPCYGWCLCMYKTDRTMSFVGRGDSRDLLCVGDIGHICIASESIRVDKVVTVVRPFLNSFLYELPPLFSVAIPIQRRILLVLLHAYHLSPWPLLLTCMCYEHQAAHI